MMVRSCHFPRLSAAMMPTLTPDDDPQDEGAEGQLDGHRKAVVIRSVTSSLLRNE